MPIVEEILTFPSQMKIARCEVKRVSVVSAPESPFTLTRTYQYWPGERWELALTTPLMTAANLAECDAWLLRLQRGKSCMARDFSYQGPRGAAVGTPVVDGAHSSGMTIISTRGWTPGTANILMAGDYLEVDNYFHEVLEAEDADGSGKASFSIWPSLRTDLTDGMTIITATPRGKFSLGEYTTQISKDPSRIAGIGFTLVECLPNG